MPTSADRRYTGYSHTDVLVHTLQGLAAGLEIVEGTSYTKYTAQVRYQGKTYTAIFLGRSSEWYLYSLNMTPEAKLITLAVVGTHDSCLKIPVYALDQNKWYEAKAIRYSLWPPFPKGISDKFRKTRYGHAILVGGLLCKVPEAEERLLSLPSLTQKRIHAEVKRLTRRRSGRPLKLFPKEEEEPTSDE
jgi:hypothetical protein